MILLEPVVLGVSEETIALGVQPDLMHQPTAAAANWTPEELKSDQDQPRDRFDRTAP